MDLNQSQTTVMSLNCVICCDHLRLNSNVSATRCGHVFHHACLATWLERCKSCPQCRAKVLPNAIFKLYFDYSSEDQPNGDELVVLKSKLDDLQLQLRKKDELLSDLEKIDTEHELQLRKQDELLSDLEKINTEHENQFVLLRRKLDDLQFQLEIKDIQLSELNKKNAKCEDQFASLSKELQTFKSKVSTLEGSVRTLTEKNKRKMKDLDLLGEENKKLTSKMTNYKNIDILISENIEKARNMLKDDLDPESLKIMIFALKKELVENKQKLQLQERRCAEMKSSVSSLQNEVTKINEQNEILKGGCYSVIAGAKRNQPPSASGQAKRLTPNKKPTE